MLTSDCSVDLLSLSILIAALVYKQIKQLFPQHVRSDGNIDLLIYPSIPKTNGADCGVFASAYAAELSGNTQGVQALFDVKAMRPHLIQCLEMESLTPFPKLAGRTAQTGTPSESY